MKFEDSWENNTHQDVEDAIKDKVEEIEGRIDDVGDSVPDAETIEAIRQAAQDAQDAAAAVGDIINENSGRVSHAKAPAVVLRYIHQNGTDDMSLDDLNAGDVYADAGGSLELVVIENGSKTVKNIGTIDKGLIFYSIREEGFFRYLGSAAWELLSQGGEEEQEGTFAELDVDSRLKHIQSPVMVLDCISQSEEPGIADCPIGGYYCYMGNQASACRIRYRKARVTAGLYDDIDLSSPQGHVLYYNKPEDKTYRWDGQRLVAVLWHAGLAIDNRLMSSRATAIVLWYISANLVDGEIHMDPQSGDVYCDSNNHIIVKGGTVNPNKEYMIAANLPTTTDADLGLPDQKLVYYDVNKKDFYRWNGSEWKKALDIDIDTTNLVTITQLNNTLSSYATKSYVDQAVQQAEQGETVVINSDGANIVDGQSDSILTAPSSRMVKEIYLNLQRLFDPVNGLAGIAFVGTRPTWQSVAIPTHTITLGTMSNVTASLNGTTINGSTSASEGEVTIKLTPSQGAMILTENISIKLGTEDVPFTTAADNGSTLVTFILAGDVTVAASALSGRNIIFTGSTGCSIGAAGVAIGQDLDTTITANEHFTLPESITVKIGNTNVTHSYTRAQGNKTATLHIDAANITGDLAITCTADEDNHAVLTFGQLSNVTIKSGTRDLESGSHIYDGETISIKPAIGYKLTGKPIFTNGSTTPVTLTPTNESGDIYNGYNFVFNPISNSTIAITNVGATGLNPNLRASLTGTGSESVDSTTDLSGNITEGSAWSTVLSVKSTAEEGTAITSVSPAMEGGTIIYDANTKRVHTDCVTGNITITVTVAGVVKCNITVNKGSNVTVDDGSGGAAPSRIGVGENVTLRFTPATGYTAAVWRVTEGSTERIINGANSGVALAESNGVLTLTINNVQGDIVVDSVEVENNHYMYYGNDEASVSGGAGEGWGVMKLLIPSDTVSIDYFRGALSNGESTKRCHISFRTATANVNQTEVHNKNSLHESFSTTDEVDRIWVSVPVANMHKIMIAVYDSNDNKTVLYKGLDYDELYGKYGIVYGKYYDNSGVLTTGIEACMTSPLAADKSHDFKGVLPSNKGAFVCVDSSGEYLGQYTASSTEKALSPRSSTVQGVADNFAAWIMNFSNSNALSDSYLKDDNTSDYIFKGENVQTT